MTAPAPHEDPFGDARTQLLQVVAVLATVGEAAARWATVGAQLRAVRNERLGRIATATRGHATQVADAAVQEQDSADRAHVGLAYDEEWLSHAQTVEVARLWRAATVRASSGDRWAREAMTRAETRLRQLTPMVMGFYDSYRGQARVPADAMRAAVHDAWHQTNTPRPAREHGAHHASIGQPVAAAAVPWTNPAGHPPFGGPGREFTAALDREVDALAEGVDPDVASQVERQCRSRQLPGAGDAAAALAQAARRASRSTHHADPEPDNGRGIDPARRATTATTNPIPPPIDHNGAEPADRLDAPRTAIEHPVAPTVGGVQPRGEHDPAGIATRQRLGRAFPPLPTIPAPAPTETRTAPGYPVLDRETGRGR